MKLINKMNKKGTAAGSFVLWFWKFFMSVVVIIGIAGVVWVHSSEQYDIRELEASLLAGKIVECFSEQGKIKNEDFLQNQLDSCLSFDKEEIFVNVTLKKQSISFGKEDLRVYCEAKEQGIEGKTVCLNEDYDMIIDNVPEKINIFIAILKVGKNV